MQIPDNPTSGAWTGRRRPLFGEEPEPAPSEVAESVGAGSLVPEDWRRDFAASELASVREQDRCRAKRGTMLVVGIVSSVVVVLVVGILVSFALLPPRTATAVVVPVGDDWMFERFVRVLGAAGLMTFGSLLFRYLARPY